MESEEANMGKLQKDKNLKEEGSKDSSFNPCDPQEQKLGTSNGKEAEVNHSAYLIYSVLGHTCL